VYVVKKTRRFYSKKIRDAWRAGEDPTDSCTIAHAHGQHGQVLPPG